MTAFARPWDILAYQVLCPGYLAGDVKAHSDVRVRWEIPGVWKEHHDRIAAFNGDIVNPVLAAAGVTIPAITLGDGSVVPGHPVYGALDFVNTPQLTHRGAQAKHFHLFAPRLGLAYRLGDKTVIRAGGGFYYLPSNTQFAAAPWAISLNQLG